MEEGLRTLERDVALNKQDIEKETLHLKLIFLRNLLFMECNNDPY